MHENDRGFEEMPNIVSLTDTGAVTGSSTIGVKNNTFGGYKLNGDGTNTATLIIRDGSSSGPIMIDTQTIMGEEVIKPMKCSGTIYYIIGGTGGDAMLYGWQMSRS